MRMGSSNCYHCGDSCGNTTVHFDEKVFCCHGCKMVYEIFSTNGLSYYYDLEANAGISPDFMPHKFDFLDNPDIVDRLLEFNEDGKQVVNFYIPNIHCSSCIWVLENLNRLHPAIKSAQVDFPKKRIRVCFVNTAHTLKDIVVLLSKIGYEPTISLEDYSRKSTTVDRSLIYKLGVAGFAFGNVMLLSFPEYFEVEEFWLEQYKVVFRWLMFAFSLPVVLFAAQDYFISAYKGLRSRLLNIDVPIALGILTLFIRSTVDIVFDLGSGFFDSLTGLVFFLLVGKFFQQKTYAFLSFERDYKSYFPIAVTRVQKGVGEENVAIYKIKEGDTLVIRNQEIIPVDCLLKKGHAQIDYSFVTGESQAITKRVGDTLYAGGKQLGEVIEVEAAKSVSQSYLTQLWGNGVFSKNKASGFQTITDAIGKRFTLAVLSIAAMAAGFWLWYDPGKAANVFTAVLIIACPCAIALAAPFTLGNMLRIFGKHGCYLKDTNTLERMAKITAVVFDKTGTLTSTKENSISYEGIALSSEEATLLKTTLRGSNHPLSRSLYAILKEHGIQTLDEFTEELGKGLAGKTEDQSIRIGSAEYVGLEKQKDFAETSVHISANNAYKGRFTFRNNYREGIPQLFKALKAKTELYILSGDNDGERQNLRRLLSFHVPMFFNQKPEDKLEFIEQLQEKAKVMMVGDGLNDAGALAQSDVGVAVAENVNVFSPACDAILEGNRITGLSRFMELAKRAMHIIKWSFVLSLCYNVVGLYFAVTGQLEPVIAAILMPLSSISIVAFTTIATNSVARNLRIKS